MRTVALRNPRVRAKNTRSSATASRARTPTAAKSWSSGSCGDGASCAGTATKCKCTTSPGSPNWHHPALASPRGRNSWRRCDASPSWSANHAMTTSTPGSHQPLSQQRHRSPESRMPGNRARPVRRGTAPKRTRQHGHLAARSTQPLALPRSVRYTTGDELLSHHVERSEHFVASALRIRGQWGVPDDRTGCV
jgi:hypothetical protein